MADQPSSTRHAQRYLCAYCGGRGLDPFGVMSMLSVCTACNGLGSYELSGPTGTCAFCHGTGVSPSTARYPCLACHGRGRSLLSGATNRCPGCMGSGSTSNRVWYCNLCQGLGLIRS
jgi:DnaJ-class molecular chaperone